VILCFWVEFNNRLTHGICLAALPSSFALTSAALPRRVAPPSQRPPERHNIGLAAGTYASCCGAKEVLTSISRRLSTAPRDKRSARSRAASTSLRSLTVLDPQRTSAR
jgi:hypothetical protein